MSDESLKKAEDNNEGHELVSEDTLRILVESAPIGMLITDNFGEIIYINKQIEQMLGYKREEILGQSVESLVPKRFVKDHRQFRDNYIASPEPKMMGIGRELYAQHMSGVEVPVEIGLNPVRTKRGVMVICTIIDITKRKRTEMLLIEREERLHEIMDNTTDAIVVFDMQGVVETLNEEAKKLLTDDGDAGSIMDIITPENKDSFSENLITAMNGVNITDYETEVISAEGKRHPVSMSLVFTPGGGGKYILTIRDISDRLMMRQKIIDLEKSQIIGKMSEGFAHHMGTPLASMLLRVQMLKEDVLDMPDCSVIGNKLDSIERQILYGQKVIQRLLRFVGKPGTDKKTENLSEILIESVEIIRPILKKNKITINLESDDEIYITADSNLLHLVFSDTMINAVDAMPDGGHINVSVCADESGQFANVEITDKGVGIAEETIQYVFEPFFTTKSAGKGTGLGLSVAKRIINDHGGEISISSIVDEGTTVLIKLPISMEVGN